MFQWSESLSTGVERIDEQHKEIIRRVRALSEIDSRTVTAGDIEEFVRFIGSFFIDHFNAEEEAMIACSYPGYDDHKAEHMKCLLKFGELKKQFDKENTPYLMLVVIDNFFLKWLAEHIRDFDIAMAAFIRSYTILSGTKTPVT